MFITAATLVAENSKAFYGQSCVFSEKHLESLTRLAKILQDAR